MTIPIYLISYNRLTSLRGMVEYLKTIPEACPIICDNASTYPPLVEWLSQTDVEVRRLPNLGHHGLWQHQIISLGDQHRARFGSEWYVVSDPDLDLTPCPKDLLAHLIQGHLDHPGYIKVGLSLEISDLPDHYQLKQKVIAWEKMFWDHPIDQFFWAGVDTTFAVYHCDRAYKEIWNDPSLRANRPYTARHLPWYVDLSNLDEEEAFFLQSIQTKTHWSSASRKALEEI